MNEISPNKVILSAILSGLAGMAIVSTTISTTFAQEVNGTDNEELPQRLVGDLGLGVYESPSEIRGKRSSTLHLPYAYIDYGRFFSRIDTLGIKTVKMGYGYLELTGRVNFDGFRTENTPILHGLHTRKNALPLGVGTYQETPVGAFFLNAFYDVNKSHGTLLEAIYAGEIKAGSVNFYPQIGAEYHSANYVNYYYGVTPEESAANGNFKAYEGKSVINPMVALQVEIPLSASWVVNLYGRYIWFGDGVKNSPIVDKKATQLYFASIAYRFK